jgi:hypothetical protein
MAAAHGNTGEKIRMRFHPRLKRRRFRFLFVTAGSAKRLRVYPPQTAKFGHRAEFVAVG